MKLSSALANALSGLRSNQAPLSIISSNVAKTQTPGDVEQSPTQVASGNDGSTAPLTSVNDQLDLFIQNQLRTETSGSGYADQMANVLSQLQSVYGTSGGNSTLESALSNFATALQTLSSNPGNQSSQNAAMAAAQSLAGQLNSTTRGIQQLRTNVDRDLGNLASQANTDLSQIADINAKLQGLSSTDPQAATLTDQRDSAINDLSKMMDVRVVTDPSNEVSLFTTSGVQLVGGGQASSFIYNTQGTLNANSLYSADPTKSGVSALDIELPNGGQMDVVANNVISSGQMAADLKLRDQTLVQAQTQVDQLAASMSSALSDVTTAGTAVAGPPAGFSVNTSNILPGNTINLTYTDGRNVQHNIAIVNVTDSSALPLQNAANANPHQIGVNFSLGMASVVSQLNSALGSGGVSFSNTGSTLNLFGSASAAVDSASTTTTAQTLASGKPQLPLFTDGTSLYTGAISGTGSQMTGLAGRITVNAALLADPSKMSVYATSPPTAGGDNTRSSFMVSQSTTATFSYSASTGLGTPAQPLKGTISSYLQQFVSQQGNASTLATQLQQGQNVVVSTLQQKFDSAAVSIDTEMSNLIQVKNTYAANAHIMSVVQSMMQALVQAKSVTA